MKVWICEGETGGDGAEDGDGDCDGDGGDDDEDDDCYAVRWANSRLCCSMGDVCSDGRWAMEPISIVRPLRKGKGVQQKTNRSSCREKARLSTNRSSRIVDRPITCQVTQDTLDPQAISCAQRNEEERCIRHVSSLSPDRLSGEASVDVENTCEGVGLRTCAGVGGLELV